MQSTHNGEHIKSSKKNSEIRFFDGTEIQPIRSFLSIYFQMEFIHFVINRKGCITPSVKLCETEKAEIKSLIKKWTKLLQFQNGCLHFEAICINDVSDLLSEGKFLVPVEINPRMGGSETWSKIKAAYDDDLLREHMNISLGIQLQLDENFQNARNQCISWDFREEFPIFIESIRIDLPQVLRSKDIVEVAIIRSPGQSLNRDIYGWLTVKANLESSEVELKAKLNRVMSLFEFNTKKICG